MSAAADVAARPIALVTAKRLIKVFIVFLCDSFVIPG
jgi:hypothetical protein